MALRMTHQTKEVFRIVQDFGHATNAQILEETQKCLPGLSATTVHRITKRLIENDMLSYGPDVNGCKTIDINISRHDHFICPECNVIKDITIGSQARDELQKQVKARISESTLTISGNCFACKK